MCRQVQNQESLNVPWRSSPCLQAILGQLSEEREAAWKECMRDYREALKAQGVEEAERRNQQNAVNPCYIPRNHLLQEVIAEAENGNYQAVSPSLLPPWIRILTYIIWDMRSG